MSGHRSRAHARARAASALPGAQAASALTGAPGQEAHLVAAEPVAWIAALVAPVAAGLGFGLVRVCMTGAAPTLQIMAERTDGTMSLADCQTLSRAVSALLDEASAPGLEARYVLEVSSPGLDRPLTRPEDFVRWTGHRVRVDTRQGRLCGVLGGMEDGQVLVDADAAHQAAAGAGTQRIGFARIVRAQLVAQAPGSAGRTGAAANSNTGKTDGRQRQQA